MASEFKRYALVRRRCKTRQEDEEVIEAYLPRNYTILWSGEEGVVVCGRDDAGWTLHDYVIPRLGSGLYYAEEIDLSHPVMKLIPND
jgi:hypothetical protein